MKIGLHLVFILLVILSCKQTPDFMDDEKLCAILVDMTESDQRYRSLINENTSHKTKDSLVSLQKELDRKSTELLIEIVELRGWPNRDSLKCDKYGVPFLIFRHAPKEYFSQIEPLINKEFEAGRIDGLNHALIIDQISGRTGLPFEIVEE